MKKYFLVSILILQLFAISVFAGNSYVVLTNVSANGAWTFASSTSTTAATTNSTQMTFRITAAGSITISHGIDLTPASNA